MGFELPWLERPIWFDPTFNQHGHVIRCCFRFGGRSALRWLLSLVPGVSVQMDTDGYPLGVVCLDDAVIPSRLSCASGLAGLAVLLARGGGYRRPRQARWRMDGCPKGELGIFTIIFRGAWVPPLHSQQHPASPYSQTTSPRGACQRTESSIRPPY